MSTEEQIDGPAIPTGPDQPIDVELIFGSVAIRPRGFITRADGAWGQEWETINYDRSGRVTRREVTPPAVWMRYA